MSATVREQVASVPADGEWVLVVEDDESTRMIYEKFLRGTRFRPVGVATLAAARELLKASRPSAVVLDILLPGEEQKTWRWLADTKASDAALPVIVASDSGDERKALSLGADAYLAKPVDRARLLEELERVTVQASDHVALIIDDDEAARYVLRRSLRAPMKFQEARDGPSGLAAASRLRPRVIFLDLSMPGMNGDEVLDRLKADPATAAIPVIIVTSHEIDAVQRERLAGYASAILQKKDLSIETLARTMETISAEGTPQ